MHAVVNLVFALSLLAVGLVLTVAGLIVWLSRNAPRRIRRPWWGLAGILLVTSGLHTYLTAHTYFEHHIVGDDHLDLILAPIVGLLGSSSMLGMLYLARDSIGTSLRLSELKQAAFTDPLTGLQNRRSFEITILDRMEIARRRSQPLAVILFDIDHFKAVNDTHGHAAGDRVLREVGSGLRQAKRDSDRVFRIGGEEFVTVLPATDLAGAAQAAERIRRQIASLEIEDDDRWIQVTASAGVAVLRQDDDIQTILARADRALYSAKRAGRNRVCLESCPLVDMGSARLPRHARRS